MAQIKTVKGEVLYDKRVRSWQRHVFRSVDLSHADFVGEDLTGAIFLECNLKGADFTKAILKDASFLQCSGCCVKFVNANMRESFIRSEHDLKRGGFRACTFAGADLRKADMSKAYLIECCFDGSNMNSVLAGTENIRSRFHSATFNGTRRIPAEILAKQLVLPRGEFRAWKKGAENRLIQLLVPEDAQRSAGLSNKARASHVVTVKIWNRDGKVCRQAASASGKRTRRSVDYKVGEVTRADKWNADPWITCTHGIHFFLTREEAVQHRIF